MLLRLASALLLFVAAVGVSFGCGSGDPDEHALVRIDRTRCLPSPLLESTREAVAVMCAEAFVARNGYTDAPPIGDTTQVALESIEIAGPVTQLLAARRNTLERTAFGVCPLGAAGSGLTVVFRYRGDRLRRTGRAVTMTARFDSLRVQHRHFLLANVADSGAACHPASHPGR